jgi:hypothetical protein
VDFGVGGCCIAACIAEDDFVLSLAFISAERKIHTLCSSWMLRCKVCKVVYDAIDDYPEILEAVML